ncbi:hypothetical protein [Methylobacter sp. YRD-M1]|uniref:hypothetical protein n=1 Tax=Methylobacter sp. YRD-M1 TaxID=2911520 RepID=UPI00227A0B3C|nr:hypothetical protein [Methylobacter sp. YRD-M1]WAK00384.1 hypothetical protein LZ558_10990 [Methylobacter sp. YRD-M1]
MNYKIQARLYLMSLANNMAELHGPNPQHILAAALTSNPEKIKKTGFCYPHFIFMSSCSLQIESLASGSSQINAIQ